MDSAASCARLYCLDEVRGGMFFHKRLLPLHIVPWALPPVLIIRHAASLRGFQGFDMNSPCHRMGSALVLPHVTIYRFAA